VRTKYSEDFINLANKMAKQSDESGSKFPTMMMVESKLKKLQNAKLHHQSEAEELEAVSAEAQIEEPSKKQEESRQAVNQNSGTSNMFLTSSGTILLDRQHAKKCAFDFCG